MEEQEKEFKAREFAKQQEIATLEKQLVSMYQGTREEQAEEKRKYEELLREHQEEPIARTRTASDDRKIGKSCTDTPDDTG